MARIAQVMGNPSAVLNHALLAIKQLPTDQKQAWREMFDYYIFDENNGDHSHIPEKQRVFWVSWMR